MTANEKYVLIEHQSTINAIVNNTFQPTQRIKFTAFDVSQNFIVFGVNSGGIYIFSREPCQFLKLIPSTHGPANIISISETEESLAVAVSSGLVIILEDCFSDLTFQQQISSEHEGQTVTALKWNGSDLYCGDSQGKVAVITLKNFLTKAIFQTPIACLMHLESEIVQIDAYSKFLLVSTLTRTLLCDTETERFQQIGRKSRDGHFGACFFNINESLNNKIVAQNRGTFQTVKDDEYLSSTKIESDTKIYCARPGVRLWQANFQANVTFTLNFRHSLSTKESEIIKITDNESDNELLLDTKKMKEKTVSENFSFRKIFKYLNDKFILSFRDDGFYIFDPVSSNLQFWNGSFSNIKDIRIVNSKLYIWYRDLEIAVLSLLTIEEMLIKILLRKHYQFCAKLCIKFYKQVESLIETSKKIHLISVLEAQLKDSQTGGFKELEPIFARLKQAKNSNLKKITNGIVTVNNVYSEAATLPESIENFQEKPEKAVFQVLQKQYEISQMYKSIETTDFKNFLQENSQNEVYRLLQDFVTSDNEIWCKNVFLKYISNVLDNNLEIDLELEGRVFALNSFLTVNESSSEKICKRCSFPLPSACKSLPQFYEVGCSLIENADDLEIFFRQVPYMYRCILDKISDLDDVKLKLPLLIQFSNEDIIRNMTIQLPYDVWDESLQLLLTLWTDKVCLNCGDKIDITGAIELKEFALIIVNSINAMNTIKLLKRYSNSLSGELLLDEYFYQYCIFATVSTRRTNQKISEVLKNEAVSSQFDKLVSTFLRKKYLHNRVNYDSSTSNTPATELSQNCDYCELPLLETPLIEGICRLKCGHSYHQVCFIYIHSNCHFCNIEI